MKHAVMAAAALAVAAAAPASAKEAFFAVKIRALCAFSAFSTVC